jgi:hypothetical protein
MLNILILQLQLSPEQPCGRRLKSCPLTCLPGFDKNQRLPAFSEIQTLPIGWCTPSSVTHHRRWPLSRTEGFRGAERANTLAWLQSV